MKVAVSDFCVESLHHFQPEAFCVHALMIAMKAWRRGEKAAIMPYNAGLIPRIGVNKFDV